MKRTLPAQEAERVVCVSRRGGREQGLCAKSGDLADSNKAGGEARGAHVLSLVANDLNAGEVKRYFLPSRRHHALKSGVMRVTEFILFSRPPPASPMISGSTKARARLEITSSQTIKPHPIV